jgi:GR25 family glycosyltransferase involved in LPS biosynthesis
MSEDLTKYLEGIDIIYYINLDRSVERRKNMEELLSHFNIPNVRISAVDGKNISDEELYGNFIFEDNKKHSKVEYACLLSHLKTLLTFSQSNYKNALIFEDDMTLEYSKYWDKTTKDIINNAPKDWDIIMLTYITNSIISDLYARNLMQKNSYLEFSSAGSYIINKNGVEKILDKIYNNNKFILLKNYTHEADHYIFNLVNTYTYKYPYFTYSITNDSTIHPDHLPGHIKSKKIAFNNTWGKIETSAQGNNTNNKLIYIILLFIILLLILICLFLLK